MSRLYGNKCTKIKGFKGKIFNKKVLKKRSTRYFFFTPSLPFIEIACFKTRHVTKMQRTTNIAWLNLPNFTYMVETFMEA